MKGVLKWDGCGPQRLSLWFRGSVQDPGQVELVELDGTVTGGIAANVFIDLDEGAPLRVQAASANSRKRAGA